MPNVTYLTDTTSDPKRHIILGDDTLFPDSALSEWFASVRPGEKFIYLRIALINAAMRMNREDRELLTDNGFIITTIPVIYKKGDSIFASYDGFEELTLYLPLYHKGKQCGIDPECADTYAALSVFKHLGEDVKKFISKNSPNYR